MIFALLVPGCCGLGFTIVFFSPPSRSSVRDDNFVDPRAARFALRAAPMPSSITGSISGGGRVPRVRAWALPGESRSAHTQT